MDGTRARPEASCGARYHLAHVSRCCLADGPVGRGRWLRLARLRLHLRSTSSSAAARSTTAPAAPGRRVDVGIRGDRIAAVGDLVAAQRPRRRSTPAGLAVAPGFINMLSWSTESLIVDGRSQGEIRQGVTLEIFGEGSSMGPLNDAMKKRMVEQMGDIKYDITWTTLAEYLQELERRGVSPNVASFVGATTIREHVIGLEDKKPTPAAARRDARAGPAGDGSGRARHRLAR